MDSNPMHDMSENVWVQKFGLVLMFTFSIDILSPRRRPPPGRPAAVSLVNQGAAVVEG